SRCAPEKFPRGSTLPRADASAAQTEKKGTTRIPAANSEPATIVALKILSCVLRVHQKLGREKVAKILAGSDDASIQVYRALSTYGLLSHYSIKSVTGMIEYLIDENYI